MRRPLLPFLPALLLTVGVLAPSGGARAEEPVEPAAPTAAEIAERGAKFLAALPSTKDAKPLALDLEVFIGEDYYGTASITAKPKENVDGKGAWGWEVEEKVDLPEAGLRLHSKSVLTAALAIVTEDRVSRDPEQTEDTTAKATRTEKGFRVERRVGEGETAKKEFEAPKGATGTLASFVLMVRAMGPEKGPLSVPHFSLQGDRTTTETVVARGDAEFVHGAVKASTTLFASNDGEQTSELHLDRKDGSVVALRLTGDDVRFVRKGLVPRAPAGK